MRNRLTVTGFVLGLLLLCPVCAGAEGTTKVNPLAPPDKDGFVPLFNGTDLAGWTGAVKGYGVENGVIYCDPKTGGNLYTEHEFSDFVFRFEFKLPAGANNGVGIRAPLQGDAAYQGMEIQILDDTSPQYAKLQPYQYHGSVYGLVAAKKGFQKPVGEWNEEEIQAIGRKIKITLNGTVIVDCDLDEVKKTAPPEDIKRHPGMDNRKGHIGWLGHGARVEFRNIRIKPIEPYTAGPHNVPPEGFTALFNGKDVTGWKGLVGSPLTRAKMTPEALAAAEKKATEEAVKHWKVEDGAIVYDGKNNSLCTEKKYGDFEMYVDWKIHPGGDSGIYIRGSPQVQIWQNPVGSGGLYNNQKNPSNPLKNVDNPPGQWNRFHIKMVGEKVWVWLNEELVVDNVTMENYWDRKQPIFPSEQIELQHHGSTLWFRNIYIKELK